MLPWSIHDPVVVSLVIHVTSAKRYYFPLLIFFLSPNLTLNLSVVPSVAGEAGLQSRHSLCVFRCSWQCSERILDFCRWHFGRRFVASAGLLPLENVPRGRQFSTATFFMARRSRLSYKSQFSLSSRHGPPFVKSIIYVKS